jgi:hypothetical protein
VGVGVGIGATNSENNQNNSSIDIEPIHKLSESEKIAFINNNLTYAGRSGHVLVGVGGTYPERVAYAGNFYGYTPASLSTPSPESIDEQFSENELELIVQLHETYKSMSERYGRNTGITLNGSVTLDIANPMSRNERFITDREQQELSAPASIQISGIEIYRDENGTAMVRYRIENTYVGSGHDEMSGLVFATVPLSDAVHHLERGQPVTSVLVAVSGPASQKWNALQFLNNAIPNLNQAWIDSDTISFAQLGGLTAPHLAQVREAGYVDGLMLLNGEYAPALGGGLCNGATVLGAAFFEFLEANGIDYEVLQHKNHGNNANGESLIYIKGSKRGHNNATDDATLATDANGIPSPDLLIRIINKRGTHLNAQMTLFRSPEIDDARQPGDFFALISLSR